jgi:nucleoside-diphosphate-sugar epimerase
MTELVFRRVAVFGAGGPTGTYLSAELVNRGARVRAIGPHKDRLERSLAGLDADIVPADALDPSATIRAADGCDLVVDCIGLPADRMADHPRTAEHIAAAAAATGARCLQISSFWAYLPVTRLPLDETHPRQGGVDYVRHRRAAEDIFLSAGAAVVNLPDFYGPKVHSSTLQQPLADAVTGKAMSWIGGADTPREYVFVPDAMGTVADLAARPEAYGERWIVPGAGPLTGNEAAALAGRALGREVKLRAAGPWMLRLVSLFVPSLRQFLPMIPDYVEPIAYDGSKLRALLGEQEVTPYPDGIRATVAWLRDR